ncbi:hypothetical protein D030_5172A, partial [Vibrio parahaemolyticus AQ3810]
MRELEKGTPG